MLRNYPVKTSIGFIIWFILITAACAIINYPVVRIIAYTSLIFYGVLQGWSIRETYMQELDRAERKNPALNPSEENLSVNLTQEKTKTLKIIIYACLSLVSIFSIWTMIVGELPVTAFIAAAFIVALFVTFRFDKVKELQTAREITMGTAVIILFFAFMLPLSFKVNLIVMLILCLALYISAVGLNRTPQRIVMFSKGDFKKMEQMERECYSDSYITPADIVQEWYDVYPYTTVAVRKGNDIAGFINMFPVKPDVSEKLREGRFNDAELELKDIASIVTLNPEKRADMFLSCIVVGKEFRDAGVTQELLYSAIGQYESVEHLIDSIYIDAVTEDGRNFAEKYGFTKLCESDHGTIVYETEYSSFLDKVQAIS